MRHVFMQIGKDQQKFEHSVALVGIALGRFVVQVVHDRQRVRQQPLKAQRIDRIARPGTLQSLIRTRECFIQKVVQA